MTHSEPDVLQAWMVLWEHGSEPGSGADWPVWIDGMPDEPDNTICIYTGIGSMGPKLMRAGAEQARFPRILVTVRADDYRDGKAKARQIEEAMANLDNSVVELGDSLYRISHVTILTPMTPMGRERDDRGRERDQGRELFSFDARLGVVEI